MSYYTFPKNAVSFQLNMQYTNHLNVFVSHSLHNYLSIIQSQINKEIKSFVHNALHSTIIKQLVKSTIRSTSNSSYELIELFQLFYVDICTNNVFLQLQPIHIVYISPTNTSLNTIISTFRHNVADNYTHLNSLDETAKTATTSTSTMDLIICEWDSSVYENTNTYTIQLLKLLAFIIQHQANGGTTIVKIEDIFYRPIVECLMIFSSIFEKVHLVRPIICDVVKGTRYLMCKSFISPSLPSLSSSSLPSSLQQPLSTQIESVLCLNNANNANNANIYSIMNNPISHYFINKIEEANAVIGQQILESYNHILYVCNAEHKEEKLELMKRNNNQKCIQWCEKNKLFHNLFH